MARAKIAGTLIGVSCLVVYAKTIQIERINIVRASHWLKTIFLEITDVSHCLPGSSLADIVDGEDTRTCLCRFQLVMNMERNLHRRHHCCSITSDEQMCVSRNSENFRADFILRTAIQVSTLCKG